MWASAPPLDVPAVPVTRPQAPPPATGLRSTDAAAGRFWVTIGALWLALCAWAWGGWGVSGDFKANTVDRAGAPQGDKIMVHGTEGFAVGRTLYILWPVVHPAPLGAGQPTARRAAVRPRRVCA